MGIVACVVGATGLVGQELVSQLCEDTGFEAIHVLTRRPASFSGTTSQCNLIRHLVDFSQLQECAWPTCEVLFCCLGTTIRTAGSQAAFRAVDLDYVVTAARCARQAGATRLVVVSAMGADPQSRVFYNRVKGDMEAAVTGLGFDAVAIVRPSLLTGDRAEQRIGERVAQSVLKVANRLLPKKYRSIPAVAVARAMIAVAKQPGEGARIIASDRLQEFA